MRAVLLPLIALSWAMPAKATSPQDLQSLRCIALLDLVAELKINDPAVERKARQLFVQRLAEPSALQKLPHIREEVAHDPGALDDNAYGCSAIVEVWARNGRLTR